jgi:PAS domain S-box-containing protein
VSLSESRALLRAILEASDDSIVATDLHSIVTSWNRGAESLYGYTDAEMIGQSILRIFPEDCPEEEGEIVRRIAAGEHIREENTVRRRRDGVFVPVALTVWPLENEAHEIVGTVRIAHDITARERAERGTRHLAAIVESSADAIVSKDLNGIVTSWNVAAERMFGYTSDEMVGRSIRTIIPDDRQGEEENVLAHIRRGERVEHFETIRRRKDGSLLPVSLTVSPVRDRNGIVVGASKIARDISLLKEVEAERSRLLRLAEENATLKDEFLATLSHELRTPLNAILGYVRMLRSGMLAMDRRDKAIEIIERNATALTQIVEDVLDISRIVTGKMRLNVSKMNLVDVVQHAVDAVLPAAEAKGIRIHRAFDGDAVPILGDPDRLQQVIWNLMSNAVKFTPRGGHIDVRLERDHAHAEIVIRDSGMGISPSFLPFIFERFRQADAGPTRERGGLGLGLGIARQLVEMHGGSIRAESEGNGQGATFIVELPLGIEQQQPDGDQPRAAAERRLAEVPDLTEVRVLVVDDDHDALSLLAEVLEATGATVLVASSAPEALEQLARTHADVLVADIAMPKMDGFELITRVRQNPDTAISSLPAAALTAYARSEDRARALSSGFQMHLAKPIDPRELMGAIATLARRAPTPG